MQVDVSWWSGGERAVPVAVGVILLSIGVRQVDRWWFGAGLPDGGPRSAAETLRTQRTRANDTTPSLLVLSVWLEIAAWTSLARVWWAGVAVAFVVGVKFRHLQEITHFAAHGVLARSRRANDLLADIFFQMPLGLPPAADRRRTHVREHHPNATDVRHDPNMEALRRAGLAPGLERKHFVLAVLFPLMPAGLALTASDYVRNGLRGGPRRCLAALALPAAMTLVAGVDGLLWGFLVARFVVYPSLAWLSLLVEHLWFRTTPLTGVARLDESVRCLRLYPDRPLLRAWARATWLPYGDAFHYVHSLHPAVRWNYLPALDRETPDDVATFAAVFVGRRSVISCLFEEGRHGSAAPVAS